MKLFKVMSIALTCSLLLLPSTEATVRQVPFIENDGHIGDENVSYYARLSSGTLFVTADGELVYSLRTKDAGWAFREAFLEKQPALPVGVSPSSIRVSQFKGSQPDGWRSNLHV